MKSGESDPRPYSGSPEAEYLRLVEAQSVAKVGSWSTDLATGIVTWSAETYRIFNVSPDHFKPTHAAFLELVHEDDRVAVDTAFINSAGSDQAHVIEHKIVHSDGTIKFIEERWKSFRDENGHPVRAVGSCRDITEQKQTEQEVVRISRLYAALCQVNKALVHLPARDELFTKVCDILVEHGGFKMASISWHDPVTNTLAPVASAGDDSGYLEGMEICLAKSPDGWGPPGNCFSSGKTIISSDSLNDPSMLPWREKFLKAGYRSSVALCLRMQGTACGVLSVYADNENFFHDKEVSLLEEVSSDISFALDNILREEARQNAERKLRGELDFFDALITSVPGILYLYDKNGKFIRWNKNFSTVTGYHEKEIAAMHPLDFIAPEDRDFIAGKILEVIEEGYSYGEARLAHKDGRSTPYYFTGTRTVIEGRPCLVGIGIDLTERKLAEEAQRKTEQNYRTLFEYAPEGIVICNSAGYYVDANPSICRMLGYTREEMIGEYSSKAVAAEDAPKVDAAIKEILSSPDYHREWELKRKDGTSFPVDVIATKLPDGSFIAMIRDLTDRNRAEAERVNYLRAEAADRIKSAFLATMSHELRTPLNSIIGFTGIILQRLAGPLTDEQAKQLEMVRGSARHLLALISDVLDISKIEAGQLSINRAPFDITSVINRSLDIVRPLADKKGLFVESDLPDDLGMAVSDEGRLQQILLNLLSNAIKFTDEGHVLLTAKLIDDFVVANTNTPQKALRIRVSDTGIGIKADDLLLLFHPFRQLDTTLARRHEGTGLGLSISMKLAQHMGGSIRVESALGKGSTFTLILPLKAPE